MYQYKVICAFTGVGKTFLAENRVDVYDIDSSLIDHDCFFAEKYMELINKRGMDYSYILVSTHSEIREILQQNKIPYYLVFPHISLKKEYVDRFLARGNSYSYCRRILSDWDMWIKELQNDIYGQQIVLKGKQFLSDIFYKIQ